MAQQSRLDDLQAIRSSKFGFRAPGFRSLGVSTTPSSTPHASSTPAATPSSRVSGMGRPTDRGADGAAPGPADPASTGQEVADLEPTAANLAALGAVGVAGITAPMGFAKPAGRAISNAFSKEQPLSFAETFLGTNIAEKFGDPTAAQRSADLTFDEFSHVGHGGATGPTPGDFDPGAGAIDMDAMSTDAAAGSDAGGYSDESFDEGFDTDEEEGFGGYDDDAGDDGAGDDGGDKVICEALYRLGLLPEDIWRADEAFGRRVPADVLAGYHLWAKPAVRLMQRSSCAVGVALFFVLPWAHHMAHLMGVRTRPHLFGALIMAVGWPICRLLGRVCRRSSGSRRPESLSSQASR